MDMKMVNLANQIRTCHLCSLASSRTLAVPGEIRAVPLNDTMYDVKIALIAEAPGKDEDKLGRPMIGMAGRLLNQMTTKAGLTSILITNMIRCRPPNNRISEASDALAACTQWTKAEISLYDPKVVVLLGSTAIHAVFGAQVKVGQTRGKLRSTSTEFEYGAHVWIATYHPAAALHNPERKDAIMAMIVEDLVLAKEIAYD